MVESIDYDLDDSERDLISELEGIQLKINQIKGSALEQDDHDLLDDTQYVSQASMVEDSIASATAFRQNRVVDRLWSFCESTVGTSKLILADSLTIPFYMPIPKGPKPKTELDVAREQARMEYIAKREIANRMAANGNNKAVLTTIPDRDASLNRRERLIGNKLLHRYRVNDTAREELLERMEAKLRKDKEAVDELKRVRAEHLAKASKITLAERLQQVANRRKEIIDGENRVHQAAENSWKERLLENDRAEQSYIEGKSQQQMEWLVLIVAVNKLQRMSRVVNDVREVKQKDILRWRSAQKIQKVYRKYIRRKAPRPPNGSLKNSPKTRAHILTQDQHHHQVYVHRQQSASLVIKFLRAASGGWKHIIFNYVKKIRLIQRRIRIHLQANLQRYQFISRYLDYIFPAIFTHVQVIRSDKGHDLRNMTSLDISQIRIQMRTFRAFHMMKEMDTVNFHAFLRKHEGLLSQMTRFFGSSAKNYSTINMEMIKRRVILDLIFQKRYQFMQRLNSFEPVVIPTITFSEQDVKRFIKEGIDPLENFLLEVKKEQDLKYEQYAEALKKSKTNLVPRQYKPGERCLLLIHEIKPEDAATIFLRATDIALHQLSLNRDLNSRMEITGGAGLKSRASQFGEMSGLDLPAEVGGMHEGPGHNNNNASRRNSVLSTGSFNQDASFDGNSSWTAPKRKASIKGNSAHHAIASLNLSSSGAKSVNFGNSSQSSGRRTSVALSKMKMGSPGGLNNSSLASSFKPSAPTSLRKSSVMHSPRANKF